MLCVLLAVCALVLLDWLAMLRLLELRADAVLCVLLAVALVLLDWLAVLCFLELCTALVLLDRHAVIFSLSSAWMRCSE